MGEERRKDRVEVSDASQAGEKQLAEAIFTSAEEAQARLSSSPLRKLRLFYENSTKQELFS